MTTVYTLDDIAEASGLSTERLQKIDDDELEALAESVLLDDSDAPGGRGASSGETEELEALSEEELQAFVEVLVADELGHDVPESAEAAAEALATAGGSWGAGTGSSAGSNNVSLTANTRKVANSHGLPTDWHALEGIDLPPSLADASLDDRGLAAAINRANGWDPAKGEGVPPRRVGLVRDKGGFDDDLGASASALNDDDDAGTDTNLDAEPPLPASTVRQRVSRHLSKTGRDAGLNSDGGFGVSLDDMDGGD